MTYHYAAYLAQHELKSAIREITDAANVAHFPHMTGQAIRHTNAAMRRLAAAQFRLMQAESEYKSSKEK